MAKQTVNIGAAPADGTGDPARDAFDLINDNFNELYTGLGNGSTLNTIVKSDPTGVTGGSVITNAIGITQAGYDAITPVAGTLYVITS